MSWLKDILATIVGSFFEKLFGTVRQEIDARQARADQQALGQANQKTVDQAEAIAAQKRMAVAGAAPAGRDETRKALDRGTF